MMHSLPKLNYIVPNGLEEALTLLDKYKEMARVKAGGTDLVPNLKNRLFEVEHIVDINGIDELRYIRQDEDGSLRIGALTTLTSLETSPLVREKVPLLSETAGEVASPQIRNVGTVGGNICLDTRCWYYNQSHYWQKARPVCMKLEGHICYIAKASRACYALFSSDVGTCLVALGASIKIASPKGEEVVAIGDFYTGDGLKQNILEPDEVVTEVIVPHQPSNTVSTYLKYRVRDSIDFPLLSVALILTLEPGSGLIRDTRVVLGAALSGPFVASNTQAFLRGKRIDDEVVEEAGRLAYKETKVVSSSIISGAQRKDMVRVLVKQALCQACSTVNYSSKGMEVDIDETVDRA
mgnify:CR=1 FL=1